VDSFVLRASEEFIKASADGRSLNPKVVAVAGTD
jgi:hypothetical protein